MACARTSSLSSLSSAAAFAGALRLAGTFTLLGLALRDAGLAAALGLAALPAAAAFAFGLAAWSGPSSLGPAVLAAGALAKSVPSGPSVGLLPPSGGLSCAHTQSALLYADAAPPDRVRSTHSWRSVLVTALQLLVHRDAFRGEVGVSTRFQGESTA